MKNTNKLLSLGVALAITLCASVQVSAMNYYNVNVKKSGQRVNPKLSKENKELLEKLMIDIQDEIESLQIQGRINNIPAVKDKLNRMLGMYHGNHPYTREQILAIDKFHFGR